MAPGGSGTPSWGWIANNGSHNPGPDGAFNTADDIVTGNPFNPGTLNAALGAFGSSNWDCNPSTANIAYGTPIGKGKDNLIGTKDDVFADRGLSFNDGGGLTPRFTSSACGVPDRAEGSSRYNFAPDNYLILPAERIALTTTGHYDITDSVRLNLLINYANSRSEVQLAPTPATGLVVTLTDGMQSLIQVGADGIDGNGDDHDDLWTALQSRPNPMAPFTIDRRMNEVGTRNGYFENNSFFFLTSLEGSLGENWDWNLAASYGQVLFNTRSINSVNRRNLLDGLAGCQEFVDGMGNDVPIANSPNCIPLDIFGAGTLTDEMATFITVSTFNDTIIEENRVTGFVRGDLFELPAGPIASVFGFEYRDTFAESTNDQNQIDGNIFGFNAIQDQRGSVDVYELYTEFAVPILSELPAAHYLGLELGFRRSNYSSVGNIDTYKIGGEWAPVEWLRFRGVFNEATRAPNVFELFQAGDQGFPAYTDPCRDVNADSIPDLNQNNTPDPTPEDDVIVAQCTADFVVYPGFTANNSQVEAFAFGNANLTPETAESLTYGVVFTPDWFPLGDLRMSVDYYDIEITDVIAAFGAQFFLNDCYRTANPTSCARVVRDPVSGQVDFVNTSVANQGALATSGYDIQLEWSVPVGPGQLTVNELYSILDSFTINGNEFAGTTTAAIGGALPDYKSVLSVSYNVGDWTLFSRWSYVPEMDESGVFGTNNNSPEASYFDASVRWNVTDAFTLTANVDNLMDESPPQTMGGLFSQANTDPQTYRVLGRSFAVSGRYRF